LVAPIWAPARYKVCIEIVENRATKNKVGVCFSVSHFLPDFTPNATFSVFGAKFHAKCHFLSFLTKLCTKIQTWTSRRKMSCDQCATRRVGPMARNKCCDKYVAAPEFGPMGRRSGPTRSKFSGSAPLSGFRLSRWPCRIRLTALGPGGCTCACVRWAVLDGGLT
jgi:hypothetical protein